MHISNFRRLQQRVSRVRDAVATKDAEGFTQILNIPADEKLVIIGIKSPEQLEDELLQLFVWIWSMKDHLKNLAVANGAQGQLIEDIVNAEDSVAIVADIANREKHGKLTTSRTGDFAKLTNVRIMINQSAVDSIAFDKSEVRVDVGRPNDAQLFASIEFESGNRPTLDAFQTIEDAMQIWETKAYPIAGV